MPDQSVMLPAGPASSAARIVWDVSEQGQALLAVLFPHLAGLRVHRVEDPGEAVMILASCRRMRRAARGAVRSRRGCLAGTAARWPTARRAAGRC